MIRKSLVSLFKSKKGLGCWVCFGFVFSNWAFMLTTKGKISACYKNWSLTPQHLRARGSECDLFFPIQYTKKKKKIMCHAKVRSSFRIFALSNSLGITQSCQPLIYKLQILHTFEKASVWMNSKLHRIKRRGLTEWQKYFFEENCHSSHRLQVGR